MIRFLLIFILLAPVFSHSQDVGETCYYIEKMRDGAKKTFKVVIYTKAIYDKDSFVVKTHDGIAWFYPVVHKDKLENCKP